MERVGGGGATDPKKAGRRHGNFEGKHTQFLKQFFKPKCS